MVGPLRFAVGMVVALLLIAVPTGATCPEYSPPTGFVSLACTLQQPCATGVPVAMAITGFSFGQTIQACDVVTWHFGDGTTASVTGSPSTSHVYAAPGRYSIAVEIRNSMGSGVANSVMFWIANGFVLPAELTSVPENGGVAHVMVMKTTAPDAPGSTSVAYHTRDGSPGVRYTSTSGVLTFAADETQKSVDI